MEKIGIFNAASSFKNFWNTKALWKGTKIYGVFSRKNLPKKIKDGTYIIKLDEYADLGTHWIVLFWNKIEIVYFHRFGVEHVPEEIKKFIEHKNIEANFFEYKQIIQ